MPGQELYAREGTGSGPEAEGRDDDVVQLMLAEMLRRFKRDTEWPGIGQCDARGDRRSCTASAPVSIGRCVATPPTHRSVGADETTELPRPVQAGSSTNRHHRYNQNRRMAVNLGLSGRSRPMVASGASSGQQRPSSAPAVL
jgi:hypothetical protein